MINLACEHCGKEGSIENQVYAGKRLRLRCPYCSGSFVFRVPPNGNAGFGLPDVTMTAASPSLKQTATALDHSDMTVMAPSAETAALLVHAEPSPPAEKPPEVDEALIIEARRIARLIISEIKLYNQEKIAKSKNKREVLELLKSDLIKGKQHYNTRIASKLPIGPDYFMETVKEILLAGKG